MTSATRVRGLFDRPGLARQAMVLAISARQRAGYDQHSPICVYGLCAALNIAVRFNDISTLEGMYERGPVPRIHLSALRPLARRAYNCGHELGHHLFGHGTTIHELQEHAQPDNANPLEVLANTFAAYLLMPTLGLRRALAARHWTLATATAQQLFVIACEFGVGYRTLVTHLSYGIDDLPRSRATVLLKTTPKILRAELLGATSVQPLTIVDEHCAASTIDAEVGSFLLLPHGVIVTDIHVQRERTLAGSDLFQVNKPGIFRAYLPSSSWAVFIRVSRAHYVGLAQYRHLEDAGDD